MIRIVNAVFIKIASFLAFSVPISYLCFVQVPLTGMKRECRESRQQFPLL